MPNVIDYQVDQVLTQMSKAYANGALIGTQLMPRLNVPSRTGFYFTYSKDKFRIEDSRRTGVSRANRADHGLVKTAFGPLAERSLEEAIEYEVRDTYPSPHDARVDATENVTENLDLGLEKEIANLLTNASATNISQTVTLSGNDQWSDFANSDPFTDIQTGFDTIKANAMVRPNTFALGYLVWAKLRHHPDLLGRLSVASVRVLTEQLLADLIGVEKVLVGDALYNTADEGQTASMSYVWDKHALLAYVIGTPKIKSISLGYTLQMQDARYVDRWDEPWVKSEFVRANDYYESKLVAAEAGYLIKNAVA